MKWKGPAVDGITQSMIGRFLQDPYQFYLYAGLGLEERHTPEPNLVWGCGFHKALELLIPKEKRIQDLEEDELEDTRKKVEAYLEYEFPGTPPTYAVSIMYMAQKYNDEYKEGDSFATEIVFNSQYTTRLGREVILRGKLDGLNHDRTIMLEHKCKGRIDLQQTIAEVPYDLQVTMYALASKAGTVIYDLIRIPDTQYGMPLRRQQQSPNSYIKELYTSRSWGDFPVYSKPHLWLQQAYVYLEDEVIQENIDKTLNPIIEAMCQYYDYCSSSTFDWQNPKHYNEVFYKKPIRQFDPMLTPKFKGSYWNFMTGQLSLDELKPVKSFYGELEE